ncbi:MAG: hypothetical protein IJW45_02480 [Oscillospiraceae bacterium]|nr:hypothetical protein [Oscillospiraceae bacterium]
MKKRISYVLFLLLIVFLLGCQNEQIQPDVTRPKETEPTATYDWMAGESPVENVRMGVTRVGVNKVYHAVSSTGVYFMGKESKSSDPYIWYVDNGTDTLVKLCGRPDCVHDSSDCNAYVYEGTLLSYYEGHLYAVSGSNSDEECKLLRMDPDGSNRVTALDLLSFAKENGGEWVTCEMITEGYLLFHTGIYEKEVNGTTQTLRPKELEYYLYKLDGSKGAPVIQKTSGALYNCGDVVLGLSLETRNGGEYGSLWKIDLEADTATYLTDHPGEPGCFGEEEGYYFRDGAICRLTYETQEEQIMVDTGLQGDYFLFTFPDMMVVASRGFELTDNHFYIYNWDFQLVDTIEIDCEEYEFYYGLQHMLIAETAERLILSDGLLGFPRYYIDKSDLGKGNVEIHEFKYG